MVGPPELGQSMAVIGEAAGGAVVGSDERFEEAVVADVVCAAVEHELRLEVLARDRVV